MKKLLTVLPLIMIFLAACAGPPISSTVAAPVASDLKGTSAEQTGAETKETPAQEPSEIEKPEQPNFSNRPESHWEIISQSDAGITYEGTGTFRGFLEIRTTYADIYEYHFQVINAQDLPEKLAKYGYALRLEGFSQKQMLETFLGSDSENPFTVTARGIQIPHEGSPVFLNPKVVR